MMIEAEMYGMMPSAKIVKRRKAPPENMLNMPRMPPCWSLNKSPSTWVDPRHRDVRADAEHDERGEQEQQPAFQVAVARGLADIGQRVGHQAFGVSSGFFSVNSTLPPAASIIERAPFVAFTSLRTILRESLPERITFAASAWCETMPSDLSAARSMSVACIVSSSPSRTSATSPRVRDLKPRLGRRR